MFDERLDLEFYDIIMHSESWNHGVVVYI